MVGEGDKKGKSSKTGIKQSLKTGTGGAASSSAETNIGAGAGAAAEKTVETSVDKVFVPRNSLPRSPTSAGQRKRENLEIEGLDLGLNNDGSIAGSRKGGETGSSAAGSRAGIEVDVSIAGSRSGRSVVDSNQRKRRKADSDEEQTSGAEWGQVDKIRRELTAFVLGEGNKVNKSAAGFILEAFGCMEGIVQDLLERNARLEGRLHERGDLESVLYRATVSPVKTYATATVAAPVSTGKRGQPTNNILIVRPENEADMSSSEDVKKEVVKMLQPRLSHIRVRNIRKLKDKSVVVELASEQEARQVEDEIGRNVRLKAKKPTTIKPRMILFDIDKGMEEQAVMNEIYEKNLRNRGVAKEEFNDNVSVIFRTGKKDSNLTNYVVRVSGRIRRIMLEAGRVFVRWGSHRVRDFISVTRCFKCQAFGHVQKTCRRDKVVCGHCAQEDHEFRDCPEKGKSPSCYNCRLRKKPHDHQVTDRKCPEYVRAMEIFKGSIDYE